ncbi:MAG: hypothetical protein SGILL_007672 [Bacillariaceae sp.]
MNVPPPNMDKIPRATIRVRDNTIEDDDTEKDMKTANDDSTATDSTEEEPRGRPSQADFETSDISALTKALSEQSLVDLWEKHQQTMSDPAKEYYDALARGDCSFLPQEESPGLIEQSLQQMEREIVALPDHQKAAYTKGLGLHSAYIHDRDHRLKFLRSEVFKAKPAALRFCLWLDVLDALFGSVALTRKIYLSDLSKEDMAAMKSGIIQVLPSRDRIGRRVISMLLPSDMKNTDVTRLGRVAIYMSIWITDDLATQQQGVAKIFLPSSNFGLLAPTPKDLAFMSKCFRATPLRFTAFHICLPNAGVVKTLSGFFSMVQTVDTRNVTRVHTGSDLETTYVLQTEYGLVAKEIQRTDSGRMKVKNLNNWLKFRSRFEEKLQMSMPFDGIDCPDFQNIAIRSGGSMFNHPPNKLFRSYLKETEEEWGRATKTVEKQRVISKIVNEIQARGFRYVKWSDSDGCYLALRGVDDIRSFVATSLRDQIKRSRAKRRVLVQGDDKVGDFFLKKPRIDKD